ncbi:hypothetical protein RCC89_15210 [Cytophagaceae bacterium ABcell3]|nr:hypothetical protein RCC89_15210 [Cytophagaceae bacterium ABcell3]
MDTKQLEKDLTKLVELKNKLATLDYNDKNYDKIEDELHDLEDEFLENYSDELETVLETVHDEHCPESDVLLPTAYIANKYVETGKNEDGTKRFDVAIGEGVCVETEEHEGKDTRLVILPGPLRVVLIINGKEKQVVWEASA